MSENEPAVTQYDLAILADAEAHVDRIRKLIMERVESGGSIEYGRLILDLRLIRQQVVKSTRAQDVPFAHQNPVALAARYAVMRRLLSRRDMEFLKSGSSEIAERRLRRTRANIFMEYLDALVREERLAAAADRARMNCQGSWEALPDHLERRVRFWIHIAKLRGFALAFRYNIRFEPLGYLGSLDTALGLLAPLQIPHPVN